MSTDGRYDSTSADGQLDRERSAEPKIIEATKLLKRDDFAAGTDIQILEFVARFFSKLPNKIISSLAPSQLAELALAAEATVAPVGARNKSLCVSTLSDPSGIIVAIEDCPFAVNTVINQLSSSGLKIAGVCQPVYQTKGRSILVLYVEIAGHPETTVLNKIAEKITQALEAVCTAVAAFPAIRELTASWTQLLQNDASNKTNNELAALLNWLTAEGFVFVGAAEWEHNSKLPSRGLGLLSQGYSGSADLIAECREDLRLAGLRDEPFYLTKLSRESLVQRPVRLTHAIFRSPDATKKSGKLLSIVGLLTSKAMVEESSTIPWLRNKLQNVVASIDAPIHSHEYKTVVRLFNSLPKHDLLGRTAPELIQILRSAMTLDHVEGVYIKVSPDASGRGLSVLVIMPQERFTNDLLEQMRSYLREEFEATPRSGDHQFGLSNRSYGRINFFVPLPTEQLAAVDFCKIEDELINMTMLWKDAVKSKLLSDSGVKDPSLLWGKYCDGFNDNYQTTTAADEAVSDLKVCETISEKNPIEIRLGASNAGEPRAISIYSFGRSIPISQALPILENIGLFVMEERTSTILSKDGTTHFVHRFLAAPEGFGALTNDTFDKTVRPGLKDLFAGTMDNDALNRLLIAGIGSGAIKLLRLYLGLYWQVNRTSSKRTNIDAFAEMPELTKQFWKIFEMKFDPALKYTIAERTEKSATMFTELTQQLAQKADAVKDKVFKGVIQLLMHTVRTNFYTEAPAIAIKLQSELIQIMPEPKPKFEIFVGNSEVEGIHLRSDMVARGGLRWSERPDDYRVEVLGLMKTQRIKNSLIVPKGAKGGFIIKSLPKDASALPATVVTAYKTFIRSLLSIADNVINDKVVHPKNVVIHDGDDPYFVVAADKGTATFSDIANEIAVSEFNFWLGDAFASGGSRGYSHKDYAITAKGAWECVKRHFVDLGIDYMNRPFTVVGIGDMSGDVFGNGLLQSQQMTLLAAFDHRNIFLDPTPDPTKSFAERKRLFQLPRSSWADYKKELISKGGGVFGRYAREIVLSPEIRAALSVPENTPESVSGDQLVSIILGAKVDLLWNGGIGTFYKATTEAHSDANDNSNDLIRLNADEIRVRVIGEGGNLGMTQKARIEANQRGIRLNTDAIDNSAGVDLSDHEVNLKILLARAIVDGKLTMKERDEILLRNVNSVCESVLDHNYSQALALTIATRRTPKHMDYYRALIREVHELGYINRSLEKLPSNEEITERLRKGHNLTRPELAVLISGGKMMVKDALLRSKLIEDPSLTAFLTDYFPKEIQEKFGDYIPSHRLAPHIIATQVVNELLHVTGISYMHRLATTYGFPIETVLKCTLAAYFILDIPSVYKEVKRYDKVAENDFFLDLMREIIQAVERTATWLMANHGIEMQLHEMIKTYATPFKSALNSGEALARTDQQLFTETVSKLTAKCLSTETAKRLALAKVARKLFDAISICTKTTSSLAAVADTLGVVGKFVGSSEILAQEDQVEIKNKWENELVVHANNQIRRCVSDLTAMMLKEKLTTQEAIQSKITKLRGFERLRVLIDEIHGQVPSPAALSVIAKQLQMLLP